MKIEILKIVLDKFSEKIPYCNTNIMNMTDRRYTLVTITKYTQFLLENKYIKRYVRKDLPKRNKFYLKTKKKLKL